MKTFYSVKYRLPRKDVDWIAWFTDRESAYKFARKQYYNGKPVAHNYKSKSKIAKIEGKIKLHQHFRTWG